MKVLGIDFVPLHIPLKNRLEALATGFWFIIFIGLMPFGILFTTYLLFFTKYWPLVCVYLFWIWIIDSDATEKGRKPNEWVRSWALFKYVVNYFPITIRPDPKFKVDANRNYLCCSFPHGYLPIGVMTAFQTNACIEQKNAIFPNHKTFGTTIKTNFYVPIFREYLLALGIYGVTRESLDQMLSDPKGGKVVAVFVGGAEEANFCHNGEYKLVLKNRKGFAKIALKNGSAIIPSFSFGQNSHFKQIVPKEGSILRRSQVIWKKLTKMSFPVIYGRGLFQYNFGIIPIQKPINIILGEPIEVPKIPEPTQNDIDNLHKTFINKLTELFEKYKYEYEEKPEQSYLTLC